MANQHTFAISVLVFQNLQIASKWKSHTFRENKDWIFIGIFNVFTHPLRKIKYTISFIQFSKKFVLSIPYTITTLLLRMRYCIVIVLLRKLFGIRMPKLSLAIFGMLVATKALDANCKTAQIRVF